MESAKDIFISFFDSIDAFLADNINTLNAKDIYDIYFDFFYLLKEYKGNSAHFTGLSEYLLFRFIYNLLGGEFDKVQISKELFEFISTDGIYRIGQDTPIFIAGKRYQPDITIYKKDTPILFIEIKLFLTSGIKDLQNDLEKLKKYNNEHPTANCLFISYKILPTKGKIYEKLMEETKFNKNLKFLILQENNQPLHEFFSSIL